MKETPYYTRTDVEHISTLAARIGQRSDDPAQLDADAALNLWDAVEHDDKRDLWIVTDKSEHARRDRYTCRSHDEGARAAWHLTQCGCCWHWRSACLAAYLRDGSDCVVDQCATCNPE